jgi:hypothetical protein
MFRTKIVVWLEIREPPVLDQLIGRKAMPGIDEKARADEIARCA